MKSALSIIPVFLILTALVPLSACGRKTPLFFRDRADRSCVTWITPGDRCFTQPLSGDGDYPVHTVSLKSDPPSEY